VQAKQNIETQNYQSSSEEYLVANIMATADVKIDLNNEENNGELSDSSLSSEDESAQKNLQTTNEEDGFILYLCGWLARKFKNKYPHLGNYTKDKKLEHSYMRDFNAKRTFPFLRKLSYTLILIVNCMRNRMAP